MSSSDALTPSEQRVLDLLADGLDARTIAKHLGLSTSEYRALAQAVVIKLVVGSRPEAPAAPVPRPAEAEHEHAELLHERYLPQHLRSKHPVGFAIHSSNNLRDLEALHTFLHR
jgi:DNA-binding CsgD family transcriptional regulator